MTLEHLHAAEDLGHSTPQLVSDTYAHLSPGHLAGQADRISFPAPSEPAKVLGFEAGARGIG